MFSKHQPSAVLTGDMERAFCFTKNFLRLSVVKNPTANSARAALVTALKNC